MQFAPPSLKRTILTNDWPTYMQLSRASKTRRPRKRHTQSQFEYHYIHLSIDALRPWFIFATWKKALVWPPQTTKLMLLAFGNHGINVSSGTLYQVAYGSLPS